MRGYPGGGGQDPPAKCPRCESTNTKFCYYNNYNLSQPRHFCKSCRRYWTKGGVLRNVPVGGGCRKSSSKRSSSSSSKKASSKDRRRTAAASRSSSDSSSLTAANDAPASDLAVYVPNPSDLTPSPEFDHIPGPQMFPETGTFTSLMTVASEAPSFLGLNFSDPLPSLRMPVVAEDLRMSAGMIDQTVTMDLPPMHAGGGIAAQMDWPGAMDQSLFDFTGVVDPAGAYWNHGHWGDTDPNLYLP